MSKMVSRFFQVCVQDAVERIDSGCVRLIFHRQEILDISLVFQRIFTGFPKIRFGFLVLSGRAGQYLVLICLFFVRLFIVFRFVINLGQTGENTTSPLGWIVCGELLFLLAGQFVRLAYQHCFLESGKRRQGIEG